MAFVLEKCFGDFAVTVISALVPNCKGNNHNVNMIGHTHAIGVTVTIFCGSAMFAVFADMQSRRMVGEQTSHPSIMGGERLGGVREGKLEKMTNNQF